MNLQSKLLPSIPSNKVFEQGVLDPLATFSDSGVQLYGVKNNTLQTVAAGKPLLKPQTPLFDLFGRYTNYISDSNAIDGWTTNASIVADSSSELNPTGNSGCTHLYSTVNGGTWNFRYHQVPTTFDETRPLCFSVYVKKPASAKSNNFVLLLGNDTAITTQLLCIFNVNTNDCSGIANLYGNSLSVGYGIEKIGNGWFRVWVYGWFDANAAHERVYKTLIYPGEVWTPIQAEDGALVWGAQLEYGTSPSPALLTTGSQITRQAQTSTIPIKHKSGTLLVRVGIPGYSRREFSKDILTLTSNGVNYVVASYLGVVTIVNTTTLEATYTNITSENDSLFFGIVTSSTGVKLVTANTETVEIPLTPGHTAYSSLSLGDNNSYGSLQFSRISIFEQLQASQERIATYQKTF